MYNQKQKEDYIDYYLENSLIKDLENERKRYIAGFNRLGKYEKKFDVDLADADCETYVNIISPLLRKSKQYKNTVVTMYKKYIDWCILTGKTNNTENFLEGFSVTKIDNSAIVESNMLKDESELKKYTDIAYKDEIEDGVHILYISCLHLFFHGISMNELLDIKESDVDLIEKTIILHDRVINMSDLCVSVVRDLMSIDGYQREGRSVGEDLMIVFLKKADTGHLIATSSENRENIKLYIRQNISKFNLNYRNITGKNLFLSVSSIIKSGIFYRIYEKEIKGEDFDFDEYIKHFTRSKLTMPARDTKIKNANIEYEEWKNTFYY